MSFAQVTRSPSAPNSTEPDAGLVQDTRWLFGYGWDGKYLGEVINQNRLISNKAKSGWIKSPFAPIARRAGFARYTNYAGYAMQAAH